MQTFLSRQFHKYGHVFMKLPTKAMILFRPLLMRDLDKTNGLTDARFIYSQWHGYLERGSYDSTQHWLQCHGIELEHLHTSGHASPTDLKRFAKALAPKALVPIHSFAPLTYSTHFDNVVAHADGEWWSA